MTHFLVSQQNWQFILDNVDISFFKIKKTFQFLSIYKFYLSILAFHFSRYIHSNCRVRYFICQYFWHSICEFRHSFCQCCWYFIFQLWYSVSQRCHHFVNSIILSGVG
uniref:Uncharacterized protein n=1 Tax=Cacopsylla melanoneura TaxID=428564 RepID=A0A8D8RZ53_9HEMI